MSSTRTPNGGVQPLVPCIHNSDFAAPATEEQYSHTWKRGDGHSLLTVPGHVSNGVVTFKDIRSDMVELKAGDHAIVLRVSPSQEDGDDGGSITLPDRFYAVNLWDFPIEDAWGVEKFVFADGVEWTTQEVCRKIIVASSTSEAETIIGFSFDETFTGGTGDDRIKGGRGNDTYVWNRGDGNDTIEDGIGGGKNDRLVLHGVAKAALDYERDGDDLIVVVKESNEGAGDGARLRLKDTPSDYYGQGVESILLDDGTVVSSASIRTLLLSRQITDGADTVRGFNAADTIEAGGGDDDIDGGRGDDTYVWRRGHGNDTINEQRQGGYNDTLLLADVARSAASFDRQDNDLFITIAPSGVGQTDGGRIVLKNALANDWGAGVEHVVFAGDDQISRHQLRKLLILQASTDHDDVIKGFDDADVVYARAGNDKISTGKGKDTIIAGPGDDEADGGPGNDIYIWRRGDGNDTIKENSYGDYDRLILHGVEPVDVRLERVSGSPFDVRLIVADDPLAGKGGTLLLTSTLLDGYGIEQIIFDDGSVWIRDSMKKILLEQSGTQNNDNIEGFADRGDEVNARSGEDIVQTYGGKDKIAGGPGYDMLSGGPDDDTYIWHHGDGHDDIYEFANGGTDRLVFKGVEKSSVTVSRSGSHLKITVGESKAAAADGGIISIEHMFPNAEATSPEEGAGIEEIAFDDGTIWNLDYILTGLSAA